MPKIKVGVFGANRGMTMISVLSTHPDAELVAICDMYEPLLEKARKLAEEHNIKVALYTNFEDFFKHDMDAVILANYATEHAPYAIRLMNSGRHVLSEVLPCQCMAEAVQLIEAVEKTGMVYAYAENYCYMWHAFEMWRRYKNGDIGDITYGEGEYIHDCSAIRPGITQGNPNHWRTRQFPNFYCTHSVGPLLAMAGEHRPVRVNGFVGRPNPVELNHGSRIGGCAALEMVTLDNGAILKSIHGGLKREPGSVNYEIYGTKGSMESQRYDMNLLNVYREGPIICKGTLETYKPQPFIGGEYAKNFPTHGGSDFYATHFFLEKILGRPEGLEWSIDVYKAIDMGICGILGYRSALNNGAGIEIPDLRDPKQRDQYRNDFACTDPAVAGDQLWPTLPSGTPDIPDEVYERTRKLWQEGKDVETYDS